MFCAHMIIKAVCFQHCLAVGDISALESRLALLRQRNTALERQLAQERDSRIQAEQQVGRQAWAASGNAHVVLCALCFDSWGSCLLWM